jgi:uncharacterized RDD family membrane protein YckC
MAKVFSISFFMALSPVRKRGVWFLLTPMIIALVTFPVVLVISGDAGMGDFKNMIPGFALLYVLFGPLGLYYLFKREA